MAYRMARLSEDFAVLNLCNTHNSGNIACFNLMSLHTNWNVHTASDKLCCQRLGTFQGHRQSHSLEMVLDREFVTTGH